VTGKTICDIGVFVFRSCENTPDIKLGKFFTRILLEAVIRRLQVLYKVNSHYFSDKKDNYRIHLKRPLIKSKLLFKVARFFENI